MSVRTPEYWMSRAIALSSKGYPAPNPHVGCVVVKNGEIVGEGYHNHAGGPHAEVVALAEAGNKARGADVYVSLEPCNHFGRTPPCSLALAASKVRSVTYAVPDPYPPAQGGSDELRSAGIAVTGGLLEREASLANEAFLTAIRLRRPFLTLKAAVSLDGKIALPNGESKWLTGERARRMAHKLRAEMGAVLVGASTVLKDNPKLTARIPGVVNQPIRIVLDPEGLTPASSLVYGEGTFYRLVAHKERAGDVEIPLRGPGFELSAMLDELWRLGLTSILIEGGAKTIGSFLTAGLADRLELFVAPIVIGKGLGWSGCDTLENIADAHRFHLSRHRQLGVDLWLTCRPIKR